jgi:hypothetical protein
MHSTKTNDINVVSNKIKIYQDGVWLDAKSIPDNHYVWMNKQGVSYCREKTEYDGNGNPFLNRSLNDPKFGVKK